MTQRLEHDSLGEITVPGDKYWGAQTERSRRNFPIGGDRERMPREIILALGLIKQAAALANRTLLPERMTEEKTRFLCRAAAEVARGELMDHFPLVIWQTGSGTQTNMNANEVIAHRANELAGRTLLHPNDDVNLSQSSNDVFPAAMHVAGRLAVEDRLLPAVEALADTFRTLEEENRTVLKTGRTHLQDAVPMTFGQEISGWRASLERDASLLRAALPGLGELGLGATAVGTGLGAPRDFDRLVCGEVSRLTGRTFTPAENKFHALTSRDELVFAHGAVKALACDYMKIAGDVRLLASGPRCGIGEITIPENEPGSSIMPGKVNPTQCEQATMVGVQVLANDTAVSLAASQGILELNVYLPVLADAFLRSVGLLADSLDSFRLRCAAGIRPDKRRMEENLHRTLMTATALSPRLGYENAARAAQLAHREGLTLRQAVLRLGLLSEEEFDRLVQPEKMV